MGFRYLSVVAGLALAAGCDRSEEKEDSDISSNLGPGGR
jgi:hypothetical protein